MVKKLLKGLFDRYLEYPLIISLFLGGISLILGYTSFDNQKWIRELLKTVGTTIISSGVFAAIVKSSQFLDIFKGELRDIIFCDENLSNRKDINDIWNKVSKHLYKEKFPEISDKLSNTLKGYFPLDTEYYYEDYRKTIDISFHPEDSQYMIFEETEEFIIKSNTLEEIEYKSSVSFKFPNNEKNKLSNYELINLSINENQYDAKDVLTEKTNKEKCIISTNILCKLKGSSEYRVKKQEKKCYSLDIENTKGHLAKWLFNKYYLEVTYPEELEIKFYENGIENAFNTNFRKNNGVKILKADTKALILPNQGTRLIFKKHQK